MRSLDELLRILRKDGTTLPAWMLPLGSDILSYGGVEYARKFNENHDPQNGRFTIADGAGSSGSKDKVPAILQEIKVADAELDERCYNQCAHLLYSPSGDLQSSEFRLCYRQCKGTL